MKKFKVKYNDMICSKCGERLFIKDIYEKLKEQYEPNANESGYISILLSTCKCGNKHKIIFDCHEYNNSITVCVNKII